MSLRSFGAPLLHSRECMLLQKMPPTDKNFVDEQRVDDERLGDASSVSSEQK